MHIRSSRQVAALWAGALATFFVSAWASTMLLPSPGSASGVPASYYIGLVGLVAIGLAMVLTWVWLGRNGPSSRAARTGLRTLLVVGGVLWVVAMLFPFL